jgi:hypothetical protein
MRERIEGLLVEAIAARELVPTDKNAFWGCGTERLQRGPDHVGDR